MYTMDTFSAVLTNAGLCPEDIIADGCIHRCGTVGKERGKDGAYVLYPDFPISGHYWNYRTGEDASWSEATGRSFSPEERTRVQSIQVVRRKRENAIAASAAIRAQRILATSQLPPPDHPYFEDIALHQTLTETADCGGVRHFVVVQRKAHEPDKGQAIAQGLFHRHVAEVVPALEQEDLEHEKRRVCRVADSIGHSLEFIAKHFFERFPVDEAIDLVQEAILVFAVSGNIVGNTGLLGSAFVQGRLHRFGWRKYTSTI